MRGLARAWDLVSGEWAPNSPLSFLQPSVKAAATRSRLLHKETSLEAMMIYTP